MRNKKTNIKPFFIKSNKLLFYGIVFSEGNRTLITVYSGSVDK